MVRAAMVIMILAGVLGLPAAACSTACAGVEAGVNQAGKGESSVMQTLAMLSYVASVGAVVAGALARQLGKIATGSFALGAAVVFLILLLQGNVFGLLSSLMLLVSGIMIFVTPAEQFARRTSRVGAQEPG